MPAGGDEWITAKAAADLLGVQFRTIYHLIDRGELPTEVTVPPGPKRRRSVRIRRQDVEEYIVRARVKPGDLRHLNPAGGGPVPVAPDAAGLPHRQWTRRR